MRLLFWLFVLMLGFGAAGDGLADDVTTECPKIKPWGEPVALRIGMFELSLMEKAHAPDSVTQEGDLVTHEFDFSHITYWRPRLICGFADNSRLNLPIPEKLTQCRSLFRDQGQGGLQLIRIWCVSRKVDPPASKGK
jgi:hypothetical protein